MARGSRREPVRRAHNRRHSRSCTEELHESRRAAACACMRTGKSMGCRGMTRMAIDLTAGGAQHQDLRHRSIWLCWRDPSSFCKQLSELSRRAARGGGRLSRAHRCMRPPPPRQGAIRPAVYSCRRPPLGVPNHNCVWFATFGLANTNRTLEPERPLRCPCHERKGREDARPCGPAHLAPQRGSVVGAAGYASRQRSPESPRLAQDGRTDRVRSVPQRR